MALFATLKGMKLHDGKLREGERAANEKVFARVDRFFDLELMTEATIASRADRFTPGQRAKFLTKFRELIRLISYPYLARFALEGQVRVEGVSHHGDTTDVRLDASFQGKDVWVKRTIVLRWRKVRGGLRVVDVVTAGSMVHEYARQFVNIIDHKGTAELMRKLDERRSQVDAHRSAAK